MSGNRRPVRRASEGAIELQAVTVGVVNVKFSRAPWRVAGRGPRPGLMVRNGPVSSEGGVQRVDVADENAIRRTVDRVGPLLRVLPLQVKFQSVTNDAGVLRI